MNRRTYEIKTALFAGSFDPFTKGHQSVVRRALTFVDQVIVGIGVNIGKKSTFTLPERRAMIEKAFANEPRVKVMDYEGLTTDFAQQVGATILLRGVRTCKDFEYEKEIAEVNRRLTGIETAILFAEDQFTNISSTIVRELIHYGKNVREFLP